MSEHEQAHKPFDDNKDTLYIDARSKSSSWNIPQTLLSVFLSVVLALGLVWGLNGFNQPLTQEEVHRHVFDLLETDEHDSTLLFSELLADSNLPAEMREFVRVVSMDAEMHFSEEEVLDAIEDAESFDDLPLEIQDGFNDDGYFVRALPTRSSLGVLTEDLVVLPLSFVQTLNVSAEFAEQTYVEVSVRALPPEEDEWRRETLFSGNVLEFVESPGASFHPEESVVLLDRPSQKALAVPDGLPYETASLDNVSHLDAVVYLRAMGGGFATAQGSVLNVAEDRGLVFVQGGVTQQDVGAPAFVIMDGKPLWLGVVVMGDAATTILISAETIQELTQRR